MFSERNRSATFRSCEKIGSQAKAPAPLGGKFLCVNVLLDLKIFAACDDLWGGPPGPRPTPPSAQLWLRLILSGAGPG
jgi:hypothetical protein